MSRRLLALLLLAALVLAVWVAVLLVSPDEDEAENVAAVPTAVTDLAQAALSIDKQRYIWDVEHIAFELETRLGKPFIQAVANRDGDRLRSYLRDDFQGFLLSHEGQVLRQHGPISERIRQAPEAQSRPLDAAQWVASLLETAARIDSFERGRLRVLQLDRDPADASRWKARLLLTLVGSTPGGEPVIVESEQEADCRFDKDVDIGKVPVIARWQQLTESLRTGQTRLMEEVTEPYGLADLPLIDNWKIDRSMVQQYWSQMAVEDFDRDGFLDIAVATFVGRPFLLRSEGGTRFRDVAGEMGLSSWPLDNARLVNLAVWIDYDNDGFPDLLMGDRLYHNLAGQKFVDVTETSQLFIDHHPMGGVVADYDCDGRLDLYLLYQEPTAAAAQQTGPQPWVGDSQTGAENQLWRNEGGGQFRNVTTHSGAGGGRRKTFAATWHFYDEDHFPDLYIANDFGNNVHLRNRGDGTFEDISEQTGMTDFATSMGVASGDIDNDGSPEIYVANMYSKMGRRIIQHVSEEDYPTGIYAQIQGSCAGNRLYRRAGGTEYEDVSSHFGVNPVGWAYAPAMVDLDGDGWLDIYASTGFMSFERGKPDG